MGVLWFLASMLNFLQLVLVIAIWVIEIVFRVVFWTVSEIVVMLTRFTIWGSRLLRDFVTWSVGLVRDLRDHRA